MSLKQNSPYRDLSHEQVAVIKRNARMAHVDAYDPATRALIHEYGLNVVRCLTDLGITKPNHIKHVVETVLNELSPVRGSYSKQGVRTEVTK